MRHRRTRAPIERLFGIDLAAKAQQPADPLQAVANTLRELDVPAAEVSELLTLVEDAIDTETHRQTTLALSRLLDGLAGSAEGEALRHALLPDKAGSMRNGARTCGRPFTSFRRAVQRLQTRVFGSTVAKV